MTKEWELYEDLPEDPEEEHRTPPHHHMEYHQEITPIGR